MALRLLSPDYISLANSGAHGSSGFYGNQVSITRPSVAVGVKVDFAVASNAYFGLYPGSYNEYLVASTPETYMPAGIGYAYFTTPVVPSADVMFLAESSETGGAIRYLLNAGQLRYQLGSYGLLNPTGTGLNNANHANKVVLVGYIPPTLTSINGGSDITVGDTGVSVVGTDFADSAGDPVVYLCSTSDYDTAPIKVLQTTSGTPSDTGMSFDVVQGGLSDDTIVYAFIVTALGQVSDSYAITLNAASGESDTPGTGSVSLSGGSVGAVAAFSDIPAAGTVSISGGSVADSIGISDAPNTGTISISGGSVDASAALSDSPDYGPVSLSGGGVNTSVSVQDAPSVGSISISGGSVVGTIAIGDMPSAGIVSISGGSVAAVAAIADTPDTATISISGGSVDGSISIPDADTPGTATIAISGGSIAGTVAYSDTPDAGSIAISGADIVGALSFYDAPSSALVSISGGSVSALAALSDAPDAGTISISGGDVDGEISLPNIDTPATATVNISGGSVGDVAAYSDTPGGASISISAGSIAGNVSFYDVPLTGAVSLGGGSVVATASYSDLPDTGVIIITGGSVDASYGSVATDTPDTASVSISGGSVVGTASYYDIPAAGAISISGGSINATLTGEILTTLYAEEAAMVLEMIAEAGQACTWVVRPNVTEGVSNPWNATDGTEVEHDVIIAFFPIDRTTQRSMQLMLGTLVPVGSLLGLMGYHDFLPNLNDYVLRGSEQLTLKNLDAIEPNGEQLLYMIEFEK